MTELRRDYNLEKGRALRIIEPILLVFCLCVISLRATFTESPNVLSNIVASGQLGSIYSLTISAILFFLAVVWLICNLFSRKIVYRYSGIEAGLGIFIVAGLISIFVASNKRVAITDLATLTAPMFMAVMLVQVLSTESRKKILLFTIVALGVVGLTQCADQFFSSNDVMIKQYEQNSRAQLFPLGIKPGSFEHMLYEHRLYSKDIRGFFTTGNSAGAFALIAVGCGLVFFAQHCRKLKANRKLGQEFIITAVIFLILVAGLIITKSKGAIVAAMLGAVMFCVYLLLGEKLAKYKWLIVIACVCVAIAAGATIVWYGLSNGRLPGGNSMLVRWQYWVGTAKMIAGHRLGGVGGGNFSSFYPHYKDAAALETVRDPHNFLLSILSQYGPLGLLGLLAAIFGPIYRIVFGKKHSLPNAQNPETYSKTRAIYCAAAISIVLLIVRPAIMRSEVGRQPMVVIYVVSVLYVLPAVVFCSLFLLMATQNEKMRLGKIAIASLFCVIVVLLIHNCIDFAIFELGILTAFWAVLACVVSVDSDEKLRAMFILKPMPWLRTIMILAVAALFGVYLTYVLIPVCKTSVKMHMANALIVQGDFVRAQALLDIAAADDRFDPASAAMNGRMKLHVFQSQGVQKDSDMLLEAGSCLLEAINRDEADFKNFEKIAEVYSELGNISVPREKKKWLQKEYDSIRQAAVRYPNSGRLRLKLANAAEMLNKNEIAIRNYTRTIEIEDSYRETYRVMYPGREMFSRLGEEKYEYAKRRLSALKPGENTKPKSQ